MEDSGVVNIIPCKWVLRVKRDADGVAKRYKARLVVCGDRDQAELLDTFAPVFSFSIVQLMISLATQRKWDVHQVDYSNAFVQEKLKRDIYMSIPDMMNGDHEGKVCKLERTLYGLRESPRVWYELLSESLTKLGLTAVESCACIFKGEYFPLLCYVDDLLILGKDEKSINKLKKDLTLMLAANDMGKALDYLGMKIIQQKGA